MDFKAEVVTAKEVYMNDAKLSIDGNPTGTTIEFNGTETPYGYLPEDGAEISREDYRKLFNVIGVIYGAGDGTTTFNVPDTRDLFIRGASDTLSVGTVQEDSFQGHYHEIEVTGYNAGLHAEGVAEEDVDDSSELDDQKFYVSEIAANLSATNPETMGDYGIPRISNETRPANIVKTKYIKYL
jgi:microcystin-dependent protein